MKQRINCAKIMHFVLAAFMLMMTALTFTACPKDVGDGIKICLFGADTSKTWNVWAWKENGDNDVNYCTKSWPGGDIQLTETDSEYGYIYTTMDLDTSSALGILFVASSGSPQTDDITVPANVLASNSALYFVYGDSSYYTDPSSVKGVYSAEVSAVSGSTLTVSATLVGTTSVSASDFTVKTYSGASCSVTGASLSGSKLTLTVNASMSDVPLSITYNGKTVSANISADCIDSYVLGEADLESIAESLGVSVSGSTATFKTWAPTASSVTLLLYTSASSLTSPAKTVDMELGSNGVWTAEDVDVSSYKYYKYRIKTASGTNDVADIWSYSASADSVASQITDINSDTYAIATGTNDTEWGTQVSYYNPFGTVSGTNVGTSKSYSDAVIYEMHIRDWSRAVVTSSTGKFLDIAKSTGEGGIIEHLKDLGVTHVQLLPCFDYAQTNSDTSYNWGYNPYHYNVPEGRYVTSSYTDGTQAVKEFRTLIAALHDAGIAVTMDVVYNHTSGTGSDSLYDMTVPKYFYRLTSDGSYSNGSGCGNEVATNHKMVKQYVIESLKHWMLDYHINGFRFDLMGCLEASTMKEIYDELYAIDPNVMVYGEPWTGGISAVSSGATAAGTGTTGAGYGAFDDDFRDAIKGGEYLVFKQGQVQGTYSDTGIIAGLTGASGKNARGVSGHPELSLHYVECHDNYTLFDKLAISLNGGTSKSGWKALSSFTEAQQAVLKNEDTLAAAYVFLSQGTPFINGGQEFLRTKQGDENSYESSDTINQITLSMKDTYGDVYNTYKGLIALRKANSTAFGKNTSATATKVSDGVTKYLPAGADGDFCVYFNATDAAVSIDTTGYTKLIDVTSGTPTESTTLPTKVEAKSFVILKK